MRRGRVVATIGLVSSVLGILGFLGFRSIQDLSGKPAGTSTARSSAVRTTTADPDAGRWALVRRGDSACAVATRRSAELNPLTGSKNFVAWARKVGELRALQHKQWRAAPVRGDGVPESFAAEVNKVLRDVEMANWWWQEMVRHSVGKSWDRARSAFEQYQRFDDSAVERANKLGFSVCNYPWPRPTGW